MTHAIGSVPLEGNGFAQAHAVELGAKILAVQAMQRTLLDLAKHRPGNRGPDCPILVGLVG